MGRYARNFLIAFMLLIAFSTFGYLYGSREYHPQVYVRNNSKIPIKIALSRTGPPGYSQTVQPGTEEIVFGSISLRGETMLTIINAETGQNIEQIALSADYVNERHDGDGLHLEYPVDK